jgi:hypothetical protein
MPAFVNIWLLRTRSTWCGGKAGSRAPSARRTTGWRGRRSPVGRLLRRPSGLPPWHETQPSCDAEACLDPAVAAQAARVRLALAGARAAGREGGQGEDESQTRPASRQGRPLHGSLQSRTGATRQVWPDQCVRVFRTESPAVLAQILRRKRVRSVGTRAAARRPAGATSRSRAPWPRGARRAGPTSTMRPRSRTWMRSACRTVERRWAIRTVIAAAGRARPRGWCGISSSVSESSARSPRRTPAGAGRRRSARAIERRCFSPPETLTPPSPITVSRPLIGPREQAVARRAVQTSRHCASVASGRRRAGSRGSSPRTAACPG